MTTLNAVADGIETVVGALDGMRVYSELEESPEGPRAGVTGEVILLDRERIDNCSQRASFAVDVSAPSEKPGWSISVRRIRDYLDHSGAKSIEAALAATKDLGISGVVSVTAAVRGERRVKYGDGHRWVGRVQVDVIYG